MGKKKVVLDTNILISALGWRGKPREIFNKAIDREFELIISEKQIEELKEVMDYPKFVFSEDQKLRFLKIIMEIAIVIEIQNKIRIIKEDPDDDLILESAIESNADFIVSGDQHLLK